MTRGTLVLIGFCSGGSSSSTAVAGDSTAFRESAGDSNRIRKTSKSSERIATKDYMSDKKRRLGSTTTSSKARGSSTARREIASGNVWKGAVENVEMNAFFSRDVADSLSRGQQYEEEDDEWTYLRVLMQNGTNGTNGTTPGGQQSNSNNNNNNNNNGANQGPPVGTTTTTTTVYIEPVTLPPPWNPPIDYWGGTFGETVYTVPPIISGIAGTATTTQAPQTDDDDQEDDTTTETPKDAFKTLAPAKPLSEVISTVASNLTVDDTTTDEPDTPRPTASTISQNATADEVKFSLKQEFEITCEMSVSSSTQLAQAIQVWMADAAFVKSYETGACNTLRTQASQQNLDCLRVRLVSMTETVSIQRALDIFPGLIEPSEQEAVPVVGLASEQSIPDRQRITPNDKSLGHEYDLTLVEDGAKIERILELQNARKDVPAKDPEKLRKLQSVASEVAAQRITATVALKYEVGLDTEEEAELIVESLAEITSTTFVSKLNLALTEAQMHGRLGMESSELFPVITGVKLDVGIVVTSNMTSPPPRVFAGASTSDANPTIQVDVTLIGTTMGILFVLALQREQ